MILDMDNAISNAFDAIKQLEKRIEKLEIRESVDKELEELGKLSDEELLNRIKELEDEITILELFLVFGRD